MAGYNRSDHVGSALTPGLAAAQWWCQNLQSQYANPLDPEPYGRFARSLAVEIADMFSRSVHPVYLSVSSFPCDMLAYHAERVGLAINVWPERVHMRVAPDEVSVLRGKGEEVVWPQHVVQPIPEVV